MILLSLSFLILLYFLFLYFDYRNDITMSIIRNRHNTAIDQIYGVKKELLDRIKKLEENIANDKFSQ